jgi:hypothetical protein
MRNLNCSGVHPRGSIGYKTPKEFPSLATPRQAGGTGRAYVMLAKCAANAQSKHFQAF